MGLNCGCPLGNSIESIPIQDCKESFGQIQKVIFQRIYATGATLNEISHASTAADSELLKATYTAFFTANDGTKMVISPYIQNPTSEAGDIRTFGGGNQTLGGIPIVIGSDPSTFEAIIYQEAQSTIKAMKSLMCENIGVWLIDEYGNIGCLKVETTADAVTTEHYRPIPVSQFFVGDKKLGGFEEPDSNAVKWNFFPNWSDNLVILKQSGMDFNPLTDLSNS